MLTTIVIVMAIYFCAMIGISWMEKKYATNFEDYLSAGRSAGLLMIIGGAMGAHIGNGLVVGGAAEGASVGLSGMAFGLGCCFSYVIITFFASDFVYKNGYMSLADYFRFRYRSELPAQIYNIATVCSYVGLLGGQLMAGKALFEALGLSGTVGVVIIAVVVFLYSQISGLWGAFATSVVQSAIIVVGLLAAMIYLVADGAWVTISDAVAAGAVAETFTSPIKGYNASTWVALTIPTTLSVLTDQASFQRICSAKNARTSKLGHILSALLMVPVCIAPAIIGMYGHAKFGATGNAAFFTVIMETLPPIFAALVVTAVIAAVMSTIDAAYIAFSQVLLNDLYRNHINKNVTDKQLSKMTLWLNIGVTLIGIFFALTATSLVNLLSNTYLFLCGACLVPLVGGRVWKGGNRAGAIAASIVGITCVVLHMLNILVLPYYAVTLFVPSLIAYVIVSLATKKNEDVEQA